MFILLGIGHAWREILVGCVIAGVAGRIGGHAVFATAELRRLIYRGYLDTEMGTSSTPEHAMAVAKRMAEEN
jgi:hypothetical protein